MEKREGEESPTPSPYARTGTRKRENERLITGERKGS